jgi:hypothetical protein
MTVREKTVHENRSRTLTTYPETGIAEGLSLQISGPCCPATDVGRAVVTSSATLDTGTGGGTLAEATTGPGMTA